MANLKYNDNFINAFITLKYRDKPRIFVKDVLNKYGIKHKGFEKECKKQLGIIDKFLENDRVLYVNKHTNSILFFTALASYISVFENDKNVLILFPYKEQTISTITTFIDIINTIFPKDYVKILTSKSNEVVLGNGNIFHCVAPKESSGNLELNFEPDVLFVYKSDIYKNIDDIWSKLYYGLSKRLKLSEKNKSFRGVIIESNKDIQGFEFKG